VAAEAPVLFVLDLVGTFAFALNGALTAVRAEVIPDTSANDNGMF
jgi:uncharacterized membrane protein YeiH